MGTNRIMVPHVLTGKKPKKVDARTLQLSNYLISNKLPLRPAEIHYSTNFSNWGMMGNDTIGDCTCAAAGHAVQSWTDDNNKTLTLPDSDIISAYSAVSGYVPGDPSTDNGAYCIDVLNYWRNTGIGGDKITSFLEFNYQASHEVEYAIYLFGLTYIGLQLPLSAQAQTDEGEWHMGPNMQGDYAPGSWGGHCVIVLGYDEKGLDVITWGMRIRMTWNFWYAYVDESYVILSTDYMENNVSPQGVNFQALQADLQTVTTVK